ncbi:MAG: chemotaxis protein CheX [Granulosicoccus sp.]|jgi:chemotaxis protein CheX
MSVISEEEMHEIVEVVWMSVLDLPIEFGDEAELALCDYLVSEIQISGTWEGVVTVRASDAFLVHAASVMFSCPVDELTDIDRSDTLTELTNMLGGTVKCMLPEPCDLSLPHIIMEDATDSTEHEWVNFNCANTPLAVAVTAKVQGAQQAA